MTFKRRVLSALGKVELLELARGLELDVTTRMSVDELRDAIAKSKRATVAAIAQESLPRDTLKEICRACGLDDGGTAKGPLVERIVAASASTGYKIDPQAAKGGVAQDGRPALSSLTKLSADRTPKVKPRRRAGVPESEAGGDPLAGRARRPGGRRPRLRRGPARDRGRRAPHRPQLRPRRDRRPRDRL